MAINQLKAGAILSYVVVGINSLVGILYTPYMLRMLGQNEYGLYSLAASIIAYLGIMDFGFGNAIIRYTAKFRAEKNERRIKSLLGMFSIIYFGIGIITFLGGLLLYFNTDLIFHKTLSAEDLSQTKTMMLLLAFNLGFTFCFNVYGSAITAYEDFIYMRIVQIIRIILNTVVMIVLLRCGYKALALVITQTVFNILTLALNYFYFKFRLHLGLSFKNLEWNLLKEIGGYSFWIFVATIADRLYWSTGPFFLGAEVGSIAVAIFSVAVSLQHLYGSFAMAISNVFLPKISILTANKCSDTEISNLFIRIGRLQFIVISFFVSGFVVFGQPFINIWAGNGYHDSYIIAVIFFSSYMIVAVQMLGITILQARNKVAFRAKTILFVGIACTLSQYFSAKYFGPMGCAISIGMAYIIGDGIIMNIYYWKNQHMDIPLFWKNILQMSILPVCVIASGLLISSFFNLSTIPALLFGIIIFTIIYIPMFWKFSLNNYERELIRQPISHIIRHV